jgi:predicted DNA binding CopG/RHH family protein
MKRKTPEDRIAEAYDQGHFKSVSPSKDERNRFRQAAKATFAKDRRVNVRLSSPDLMDIQARAAEEGVPYQTLIASVLHKFVSGRFVEPQSELITRSRERSKKKKHAA